MNLAEWLHTAATMFEKVADAAVTVADAISEAAEIIGDGDEEPARTSACPECHVPGGAEPSGAHLAECSRKAVDL